MTYKEDLTQEMNKLAQNPRVRFVGYNLKFGSKFYGTLVNVPEDRIIETPVAENLMCGIAMGLALEGFLPVLCFERMDFTLVCADALINQIGALQHYGLILPMIIRVCIGTDKPLDPGWQHKQQYIDLFNKYHSGIMTREVSIRNIKDWYTYAGKIDKPIMLVERKEWYEQNIIA